MDNDSKYNYTPLPEPVLITEQKWAEDILPLVTTRTITYMHEPYIRDCIKGILMQKTTFPVEVVIHDDASTDKTAKIIQEYELKYPGLIKPIYQTENQYSKPGRGNMRADIEKAVRGKYIALCEGDDYWTDPLKLQKQVDHMEDHPETSVCTHAANIFDVSFGKFTGVIKPSHKNKGFTVEEVIEGGGGLFSTNSMFYKTQHAVNRPSYYNFAPAGDYVQMIHLALAGKVYYFDDLMSVYRKGNSASWTATICSDPQLLVDHYIKTNIMLEEINKYTEYKYNDIIAKTIRKNNFHNLIRQGEFKKASQGEFKHHYNTYFSSLGYKAKAKLLLGKYCPLIYQNYTKIRQRFLLWVLILPICF